MGVEGGYLGRLVFSSSQSAAHPRAGFGVCETTKQGVLPGCDGMTVTPQLRCHPVSCEWVAPAEPFHHVSCFPHVHPLPSSLVSELLKWHHLSAFVSHRDLLQPLTSLKRTFSGPCCTSPSSPALAHCGGQDGPASGPRSPGLGPRASFHGLLEPRGLVGGEGRVGSCIYGPRTL